MPASRQKYTRETPCLLNLRLFRLQSYLIQKIIAEEPDKSPLCNHMRTVKSLENESILHKKSTSDGQDNKTNIFVPPSSNNETQQLKKTIEAYQRELISIRGKLSAKGQATYDQIALSIGHYYDLMVQEFQIVENFNQLHTDFLQNSLLPIAVPLDGDEETPSEQSSRTDNQQQVITTISNRLTPCLTLTHADFTALLNQEDKDISADEFSKNIQESLYAKLYSDKFKIFFDFLNAASIAYFYFCMQVNTYTHDPESTKENKEKAYEQLRLLYIPGTFFAKISDFLPNDHEEQFSSIRNTTKEFSEFEIIKTPPKREAHPAYTAVGSVTAVLALCAFLIGIFFTLGFTGVVSLPISSALIIGIMAGGYGGGTIFAIVAGSCLGTEADHPTGDGLKNISITKSHGQEFVQKYQSGRMETERVSSQEIIEQSTGTPPQPRPSKDPTGTQNEQKTSDTDTTGLNPTVLPPNQSSTFNGP